MGGWCVEVRKGWDRMGWDAAVSSKRVCGCCTRLARQNVDGREVDFPAMGNERILDNPLLPHGYPHEVIQTKPFEQHMSHVTH